MKPLFRKFRPSPVSPNPADGQWMCMTPGACGVARTIQEAYESWQGIVARQIEKRKK